MLKTLKQHADVFSYGKLNSFHPSSSLLFTWYRKCILLTDNTAGCAFLSLSMSQRNFPTSYSLSRPGESVQSLTAASFQLRDLSSQQTERQDGAPADAACTKPQLCLGMTSLQHVTWWRHTWSCVVLAKPCFLLSLFSSQCCLVLSLHFIFISIIQISGIYCDSFVIHILWLDRIYSCFFYRNTGQTSSHPSVPHISSSSFRLTF